jgi:hypothetical protein
MHRGSLPPRQSDCPDGPMLQIPRRKGKMGRSRSPYYAGRPDQLSSANGSLPCLLPRGGSCSGRSARRVLMIFAAIRTIKIVGPVVSHARVFADCERRQVLNDMRFAAHLAWPDVYRDHFGEAGSRRRDPAAPARRHERRWGSSRGKREPADCKWPRGWRTV